MRVTIAILSGVLLLVACGDSGQSDGSGPSSAPPVVTEGFGEGTPPYGEYRGADGFRLVLAPPDNPDAEWADVDYGFIETIEGECDGRAFTLTKRSGAGWPSWHIRAYIRPPEGGGWDLVYLDEDMSQVTHFHFSGSPGFGGSSETFTVTSEGVDVSAFSGEVDWVGFWHSPQTVRVERRQQIDIGITETCTWQGNSDDAG